MKVDLYRWIDANKGQQTDAGSGQHILAVKRDLTDVSSQAAGEFPRALRLTMMQDEIEELRDLSYPHRIKKQNTFK